MKKIILCLMLVSWMSLLLWSCKSGRRINVSEASFTADGWEKDQVPPNTTTNSTGYVFLDCGPIAKTGFSGCAYMSLPVNFADSKIPASVSPNPNAALVRVRLRNNKYDQVKLEDLAQLTYWTYVLKSQDPDPSHNPIWRTIDLALQLELPIKDQATNKNVIQNIYFSPNDENAMGITTVKAEEWQSWDAFNGVWHELMTPGQIPRVNPATNTFSIAEYLAHFGSDKSQVKIVNDKTGGAIRLTIGGSDHPEYANTRVYLAGFQIKTNSIWDFYDFVGPCPK